MKESSVLVLTLTLMISPRVMASTSPSTPTEVSPTDPSSKLTIEVDAAVPRTDGIRQTLEKSGQGLLTGMQAHFADGDRIFVRISGEQYDYHIRIITTRRGTEIEERTMSCECSDTELKESVDVEIRRVASLLIDTPAETMLADPPAQTQQPRAATTQEPAPAPAEPLPQPLPVPEVLPAPGGTSERAAAPEPEPRSSRAKRMRLAGVATLIASSAVLFVGTGMVGAGSTELREDWPHYKRDWRPLGLSMGGLGLGGIVVGGSLMIIDDMRCRRRPHSCISRARSARRQGFNRILAMPLQ